MSRGEIRHHPARPAFGVLGEPRFTVRADADVSIWLKRLFPRADPHGPRTIELSDTDEVCRDLEWMLQRFELTQVNGARERIAQGAESHRRSEVRVRELLAGHAPPAEGLLEPIRPAREYQRIAADLALATGRLLVADELGLGKAQPLDALVLTPRGFVPMGSVQPGDVVVAASGDVTQVRSVHPQGERDVYRVTFSDGASVECDAEHLWSVRRPMRTRSKRTGAQNPVFWGAKSVRELLDRGLRTSDGQAKWHVPMITAPGLEADLPRPLNPYFLGLLLGDAGLAARHIVFTTKDQELVHALQTTAPAGIVVKRRGEIGYGLTHERPTRVCSDPKCSAIVMARGLCGRCYQRATHHLKRYGTPLPSREGRAHHPVLKPLRELGLWGHGSLSKFVPVNYKLASAADRLALLQGLMDTDGYAMPLSSGTATAQFYSSSSRLAEDVRWLAQSLGGTGRLTSKWFAGRARYTVTVKLPAPFNPFRLTRKADAWGNGHKTLKPTRAIVSIEPVGRKAVQCIAIEDPSHLYVTDEFVVTHNTMTAALALRDPRHLPALIVCPAHLPAHWLRELAKTFPTLRAHVIRTLRVYDPAKRREMRGHVPDVLICSYAKLRGWADHLAGQVRAVVFDEAQELRRPGTPAKPSLRYQAAKAVAESATLRVQLSATPIYNYGGELHNVLSVIAPDALGSRSEFAREWCDGSYWSDKVRIADPEALGAHLRRQGLMVRRTRAEVGRELPDVVRVVDTVDADAAAFDAIEADASALAERILAREGTPTELWQAHGDFDWAVRRATGVAKAPYVAEFVRMLAETDEPVVLFGWHRQVYRIWLDKLADLRPAMYTGSESAAAKERARARFLDGEARVLVMSLRSGAGLDGLQDVAKVCVFGELDWSPGVLEQCVGRLHRDGQAEPVVAYTLVSGEGSDPEMAEVLDLKRSQSEPLLDPDRPLFEPAADPTERMQRVAKQWLAKHAPGALA